MELTDAVALIDHPYIHAGNAPQCWADLGAGTGLFSLALASVLPPGSTLHLVDRISRQPPAAGAAVQLVWHTADFERDSPERWNTGPLDGMVMANSLHYVADKAGFLSRLASCLVPGGLILLVEYDSDVPVSGWVPYPLSLPRARDLLAAAGFTGVERVAGRPSVFGHAPLYSVIGKLAPRRAGGTWF